MTRWLHGLSEWADDTDGWIVDQFGVMHDGRDAYPGAAEAMRRLVARGDTVIVLSNSGKRNGANARRLAARGFDRTCYTTLLTSGELAHGLLARRDDPLFARLGPRCRLIANDGDRSLVEGLPLQTVDDAARADFVLIAGVGGAPDASAFESEFRAAIARGLPAICTNPDFLRLEGHLMSASSGALARRYEALGGEVRWIGKPHPEVYAWCRAEFERTGRRRITAIGDSLEHDVAGAQRAGWHTLLVAGGLHRDTLLHAVDREAILRRLMDEHGIAQAPDAALDVLRW
jgi:HAD superfamily hydrolase (TIGR01459 family)